MNFCHLLWFFYAQWEVDEISKKRQKKTKKERNLQNEQRMKFMQQDEQICKDSLG